jgi:hypothetical protein
MGGGPGGRNTAGRLQHGGEWLVSDAWPPAWATEPSVLWLMPEGELQVQVLGV